MKKLHSVFVVAFLLPWSLSSLGIHIWLFFRPLVFLLAVCSFSKAFFLSLSIWDIIIDIDLDAVAWKTNRDFSKSN